MFMCSFACKMIFFTKKIIGFSCFCLFILCIFFILVERFFSTFTSNYTPLDWIIGFEIARNIHGQSEFFFSNRFYLFLHTITECDVNHMHVWRWIVHLLISILFIKFQKLLILFSQWHRMCAMNLSHRMWVTRLKIRFVCCECSDYNQLIDFRLFEWWKWCALSLSVRGNTLDGSANLTNGVQRIKSPLAKFNLSTIIVQQYLHSKSV